jgi:hypothetical protein
VGPPPSKPRTGLITSLIIVAILVVGGGGVGAYLLLSKDNKASGDSGGSDPRSVAETYVSKLKTLLNTDLADIDLQPLRPLACADDYRRLDKEISDARDFSKSYSASPGKAPQFDLTMRSYEATSQGATFTLVQTADGDKSESRDMTVAKENGDWKVCGLYRSHGQPSTSSSSGEDDHSPTTSRRVPPNPFPPSS